MEERKPGYDAKAGDTIVITDAEHIAASRSGTVKRRSAEIHPGELYVNLHGDPPYRYVKVLAYQCEVVVD